MHPPQGTRLVIDSSTPHHPEVMTTELKSPEPGA